MIDDIKLDLALYRLKKAKDLLSQGRLLHENRNYDGSINRSYYAIFNAIRALLALVELDSLKHSGVISFFDKYFVKTCFVDKEFSKIAHAAFDIRQENDYEDFYEPTEEESQTQLNDAEKFLREIEVKIHKMITNEIVIPQITK